MDTCIYPTDKPHIKVLDKGFIALVDSMGNDRRIVDAARVSYQQGTTAVQSDRHLIRYLLKNRHTSPFEKVVFEFHVKCPIFIARQWMRHRTGAFNEISARYSVMKDEFYVPDPVRKQSSSNRQGSSDETVTMIPLGGPATGDAHNFFEGVMSADYEDYELLINAGVARELARIVLPVALYTEFYWTVNLWNLIHFLSLRLDQHAQYEIRVFGEAIVKLIEDNCDLKFAMEAAKDYVFDAPNLSKFEVDILIKSLLMNGMPQASIDVVLDHAYQEGIMSKRESTESKLRAMTDLCIED